MGSCGLGVGLGDNLLGFGGWDMGTWGWHATLPTHPISQYSAQYSSVLQSTTPVPQSTTQVPFRTPVVVVCATPYYKVLLQQYSALQRIIPHYYVTLLLDSTITWLYCCCTPMSLVYRKFLHLNFLLVSRQNRDHASYLRQGSARHIRVNFPRHNRDPFPPWNLAANATPKIGRNPKKDFHLNQPLIFRCHRELVAASGRGISI